MRFLCEGHRRVLVNNPYQAVHCWQDNFDKGSCLIGQQCWEDAIPYLGCAFETTEILMTASVLEPYLVHELFVSTTKLLAEALAMAGYDSQSQGIYYRAVQRLEQQISQGGGEIQAIKNDLSALYSYLNPRELSVSKDRPCAVH